MAHVALTAQKPHRVRQRPHPAPAPPGPRARASSTSPAARRWPSRCSERELRRAITEGRTGVIDLTVEGDHARPVLLKDVQLDPVRGDVLHVDFQEVNLTQEVEAPVQIVLVGSSGRRPRRRRARPDPARGPRARAARRAARPPRARRLRARRRRLGHASPGLVRARGRRDRHRPRDRRGLGHRADRRGGARGARGARGGRRGGRRGRGGPPTASPRATPPRSSRGWAWTPPRPRSGSSPGSATPSPATPGRGTTPASGSSSCSPRASARGRWVARYGGRFAEATGPVRARRPADPDHLHERLRRRGRPGRRVAASGPRAGAGGPRRGRPARSAPCAARPAAGRGATTACAP